MKYIVIFDNGEIRCASGCENIKEAFELETKLNPGDRDIISISFIGFDES